MEAILLEATPREVGTKAARAVRRAGNVPCVLYGHQVTPVAFQVPELSLRPLIYTDAFHQVSLLLEGKKWSCMMKDIAFDPVSERPLHADFQVLKKGEKVNLTVPVQLVGTPAGKLEGGLIEEGAHELDITCLPKDLPSHITVDISHLEIGDSLYVRDLDMPGIEFQTPGEQILVAVVMPRAAEQEEAEEAVGLDEAAPEETAE